ncbi:MAG: PDZ domain-containing protein [Pyrinomonadaceae bacterium]
MRTSKIFSLFTLVIPIVFVVGLFCVTTLAQTPPASPESRKTVTATTVNRVILENKPAAPQVVTILHSLTGLKVIRLLISKEQAEVIARLDEDFNLAGEVHMNVIAGLALDDGQTIAAWLPEAEAEMLPRIPFAPRAPLPPRPSATTAPPVRGEPIAPVSPPSPIEIPDSPSFDIQGNLFEPADLRIITRDGKRILGRYLGLDGLTGLSLISLPNGSLPASVALKQETVTVGQRVRVIGPQPAPGPENGARTRMYIRIGETEGLVVNVTRSPSGGIARVKVKSSKFSPANIGGIAINDNNETLGIVDSVEGGEATIVPLSLVRMAAKRVTTRQASVPRPWLGIRGEAIGAISLERILRIGWQLDRARALTEKGQGILLTSVAPGSPAALAKLKPGDVILSVNDGDIGNAEEFSSLLDEAGPESPVHFTIARPEREFSEAMEIKLSESPDPFFPRHYTPRPLLGEGIEAIALKPRVASRFGSSGGLLVVSIRPATAAFKAGLRPGDVIESIDGQPAYSGATVGSFPVTPGVRSSCIVVRNKERISLTFQYSPHEHEPDKP